MLLVNILLYISFLDRINSLGRNSKLKIVICNKRMIFLFFCELRIYYLVFKTGKLLWERQKCILVSFSRQNISVGSKLQGQFSLDVKFIKI